MDSHTYPPIIAARLFVFAAALALMSVGILGSLAATPLLAQTPNQAALIVSYAPGVDEAFCVEFSEAEITGIDLLLRTGMSVESEPYGGLGEAICLIGRTGCDDDAVAQTGCFCQCISSECQYWSYWQREGGAWTYSARGARNMPIRHGSVDVWVWGQGMVGQTADRLPPDLTFDQVCRGTSNPTATPSPKPVPPAPLPPVARPKEVPEPISVILLGTG